MVAIQIPTRPDRFTRLRVETGCPISAEVDENVTLLDDRRGRGIGVLVADLLRLRDVEDMPVVQNASSILIDTDGVQLVPVGRRRRQPDLIAVDHWRGPAAIVDRCLPRDVLAIRPLGRQVRRVRMTIAGWAEQLPPGFFSPAEVCTAEIRGQSETENQCTSHVRSLHESERVSGSSMITD